MEFVGKKHGRQYAGLGQRVGRLRRQKCSKAAKMAGEPNAVVGRARHPAEEGERRFVAKLIEVADGGHTFDSHPSAFPTSVGSDNDTGGVPTGASPLETFYVGDAVDVAVQTELADAPVETNLKHECPEPQRADEACNEGDLQKPQGQVKLQSEVIAVPVDLEADPVLYNREKQRAIHIAHLEKEAATLDEMTLAIEKACFEGTKQHGFQMASHRGTRRTRR